MQSNKTLKGCNIVSLVQILHFSLLFTEEARKHSHLLECQEILSKLNFCLKCKQKLFLGTGDYTAN